MGGDRGELVCRRGEAGVRCRYRGRSGVASRVWLHELARPSSGRKVERKGAGERVEAQRYRDTRRGQIVAGSRQQQESCRVDADGIESKRRNICCRQASDALASPSTDARVPHPCPSLAACQTRQTRPQPSPP
jgi:hypothetical protein